ncbi:MAG: ferredoxin [Alphaproteobacteria bacterium]|nr:ferredoxin [Alphaproteobacteria bacterium]
MAKIEVNKELCIGCGSCVSIAPDSFEFGDDGLAQAKTDEITEDVIDAKEGCPTEAIQTEE